jgi:hypothetical protein
MAASPVFGGQVNPDLTGLAVDGALEPTGPLSLQLDAAILNESGIGDEDTEPLDLRSCLSELRFKFDVPGLERRQLISY